MTPSPPNSTTFSCQLSNIAQLFSAGAAKPLYIARINASSCSLFSDFKTSKMPVDFTVPSTERVAVGSDVVSDAANAALESPLWFVRIASHDKDTLP